jgi:hypothetical protein
MDIYNFKLYINNVCVNSKIQRAFVILLLTLLLSIAIIHSASSTGLGVSPHSIEFSNLETDHIQRNITVFNNGETISHYHVYADSEYAPWLDISPSGFELAPGESGEVAIDFHLPAGAEGNRTFRLYILAGSGNSGLDVCAGIKIPVYMHLAGNTTVPETTFYAVLSLFVRGSFFGSRTAY